MADDRWAVWAELSPLIQESQERFTKPSAPEDFDPKEVQYLARNFSGQPDSSRTETTSE